MATVTIEFTPSPEAADPADSTGLTLDAFEALMDFLMSYAEDDIRITREQ